MKNISELMVWISACVLAAIIYSMVTNAPGIVSLTERAMGWVMGYGY